VTPTCSGSNTEKYISTAMPTASSPTLYRSWRKKVDVVMRQVYRAGEKIFVDFPGQRVPIYDSSTGAVVLQTELFVAVLAASNYLSSKRILPRAALLGHRTRASRPCGAAPTSLFATNCARG
jgi:transposase